MYAYKYVYVIPSTISLSQNFVKNVSELVKSQNI